MTFRLAESGRNAGAPFFVDAWDQGIVSNLGGNCEWLTSSVDEGQI